MRCSCGSSGTIVLARRDLPYCTSCFEQLIVSLVRKEAGKEPVQLRPMHGYFLDAVQAACKLAKREVQFSETGKTPGCTETAAAAVLRYLLGYTDAQEDVFPKTVTLEELQTFFKAEQPVILDALTEELIAFDKAYPGTTRSIVHYGNTQR